MIGIKSFWRRFRRQMLLKWGATESLLKILVSILLFIVFGVIVSYIVNPNWLSNYQLLIEPLLMAIKNGSVWRNLEKFLSLRVETETISVAKIYRAMHEKIVDSPSARYIFYNKQSDKILKALILNPNSRKDAFRIIDIIFRNGNDRYRDLYEEYS